MLGRATVFEDPHWFWSDQFGLNLQHAGHAEKWDDIVIRGSVQGLEFIAFYLHRGVAKAAFSVERGGDMFIAKELIAAQARPDRASLADEGIELAELLTS
jgi:3-phenylpropionate/trans-cinnamate dioxygenase ferredoxin reductase component